MIISQTPYRVSFAGGGTDLPAFYREEPGAVLSVTINQHMYVTVHRRFGDDYRVAYSRTEIVGDPAQLQHELVREALGVAGVNEPVEITTIGDVPAGTGMGSSSSLTAGLLVALHGYQGELTGRERVAREACEIEIQRLGKPIGKQDQYAAAFGGLNHIRFLPDDSVEVEPVPALGETLRELERRTLLIFTEQTRSADEILRKQSSTTNAQRPALRRMRELAGEMRGALCGSGDLDAFAEMLHEGWELKRSLGNGITNSRVDQWYSTARGLGAGGGKLLGAGGGGFLLLMAEPRRHPAILEALGRPRVLSFEMVTHGSRCIYFDPSTSRRGSAS